MSELYQRAEGVEAAPMEGETLLYHKESKQFCRLNGPAAFMWERLEEPRSLDEIATDMCEAYDGVEFDQARADVQAAVEELARLSIIVETQPTRS